ncbi:MAG: hypothetical protein ACKVOP_14340 [Sphingomonadaceae bacterium]
MKYSAGLFVALGLNLSSVTPLLAQTAEAPSRGKASAVPGRAEEEKLAARLATGMTAANTVTVNCGATPQQINISTGTGVPIWFGFAGPPASLAGGNASIITTPPPPWAATAGVLAPAQWVQRANVPVPANAPDQWYYYRIRIVVGSTCVAGVNRVIVEGRAAAADTAQVHMWKVGAFTPPPLLGNTIGFPATAPLPAGTPPGYTVSRIFTAFNPLAITGPGTYIMAFQVKHKAFNGSFAQGIIFQGFITF